MKRLVLVDLYTSEHKLYKAVYDYHLVTDLLLVPGLVTAIKNSLQTDNMAYWRSPTWWILDTEKYPDVWHSLNSRRTREYGYFKEDQLSRQDIIDVLAQCPRIKISSPTECYAT